MRGNVPAPIRVVLADDHPIVREGTQALLERTPGIEVAGVAAGGATALALVAAQLPDVLLLDLHLPDLDGFAVARQMRERFPRVAILVLTGHDDAGYVRELRQLGVRGYLGKSVASDQIVAAIRTVAGGGTVLVSEAARAAAGEGSLLTPREREVLGLVAAGRRNKEIAQALSLSEKTVEFHLTNLFMKLHTHSRTELALAARERGLLDPRLPIPAIQ
jgi:DNA-binding NarL/FixJ family response regulator